MTKRVNNFVYGKDIVVDVEIAEGSKCLRMSNFRIERRAAKIVRARFISIA